MAADKNGGHRADTSKVSFWVADTVLGRWDAFCENEGIKRTDLIIQAANEWVRTHVANAKGTIELATLKEYQQQLVEKMDQVVKGIATEAKKDENKISADLETKLRGKIAKYLARGPARHDDMADVMGADVNTLITVLTSMKEDNLVSRNKKGEWFLNDN